MVGEHDMSVCVLELRAESCALSSDRIRSMSHKMKAKLVLEAKDSKRFLAVHFCLEASSDPFLCSALAYSFRKVPASEAKGHCADAKS